MAPSLRRKNARGIRTHDLSIIRRELYSWATTTAPAICCSTWSPGICESITMTKEHGRQFFLRYRASLASSSTSWKETDSTKLGFLKFTIFTSLQRKKSGHRHIVPNGVLSKMATIYKALEWTLLKNCRLVKINRIRPSTDKISIQPYCLALARVWSFNNRHLKFNLFTLMLLTRSFLAWKSSLGLIKTTSKQQRKKTRIFCWVIMSLQ